MLDHVICIKVNSLSVCGTVWTRTDVKRGTVGPGFVHRVKSITVLKALLPAGVRPSHNVEFVVQ